MAQGGKAQSFRIEGRAQDGNAVLKLDPKVARAIIGSANQRIRVDTPGQNYQIAINPVSTDTFMLQFTKDGQPVEGEIRFTFHLELVPHGPEYRRVIKEDLSKPSVPCTTYTLGIQGNQAVFDFGYFPIGWTYEMIPEYSIEAHTRLQMDVDLLHKIYLDLDRIFKQHPYNPPAI